MEERILQDPISIGILSKYTRFAIKERITRIYEILVQDIGSTKNIWETSSLQFKIEKYCGTWEHFSISRSYTSASSISKAFASLSPNLHWEF